MRGTITRLLDERGFGFIGDGSGDEFFFHLSALQGLTIDELAPGIALEFEVDRNPEGDRPDELPRAVNLRLADDAIPAVDGEILAPEKTGR